MWIELLGRQMPSSVQGEQPRASITNYYRGTFPRDGRFAIPHYGRVRFDGIYPGIDMTWCSRGTDLEYEFRAAAGADPGQIRLHFRGPRSVSIDAQGNLVLETESGTIRHRRPVAWQEIAGQRRDVQIEMRLAGATATFRLGPYDKRQPLWIDPVVSYASYIGGAGYDAGYAIATDGVGGVYMTGTTASASFPAQGSSEYYNNNAFVMKFNESGQLLYTTILAGNGNSSGQAIVADSSGNVYIAGTTEASNFPVTKGAWQTVFGGVADAFAAKLNPAGNVVYATYIGGSGQETGTGIAIDSSGNAYVSGYTSSTFPTTAGAAQTLYGGGFADAFVVKLNVTGGAAVYSTLLGGTGNDEAEAIVVNASGDACVAGYTDSANLPIYNAPQPAFGGEGDALIACLNAGGTAWTMVSYLGGSNLDQAYALAIDSSGDLYVAGATYSQDFPTTSGVVQPAPAGGYDAFIAELSPGGAALVYATYLGGNGNDAATTVAAGKADDIWVGGYTTSTNFPLASAWQTIPGGSFDGFISHLSPGATGLLGSSYLGGTGDDRVYGIAVDPTGLVFTTGSTMSSNFPVTRGAMQAAAEAGVNAYLANVNPSAFGISGQITAQGGPLSGVQVTLSGSAAGATVTDSNGDFSFGNLTGGGSYTVTPARSGYTFSPSSATFNNLNGNQIANFTEITAVSISGNIGLAGGGALSGAVVMLSGASCSSTKTDASGNYSFTGLVMGTYIVTPSLINYAFNPFSQTFTNVSSNQTANFTASTSPFAGPNEVVWQDPVSGFSQIWFLGGAQGTSYLSAATITTKNIWRIAAIADFNGDGYPDIVWQDPVSGASQVWFMTGPQGITLLEAATLSGPNPWRIVAAADFNQDGHPDLLWQAPSSGWAQIWYLGGPQGITIESAANLTLKNPWQIVGVADFNQDGHPDVVWQDPVHGTVQIWYLTGALGNQLLTALNLTTSTTSGVVGIEDFNHDGHPDVVWENPVWRQPDRVVGRIHGDIAARHRHLKRLQFLADRGTTLTTGYYVLNGTPARHRSHRIGLGCLDDPAAGDDGFRLSTARGLELPNRFAAAAGHSSLCRRRQTSKPPRRPMEMCIESGKQGRLGQRLGDSSRNEQRAGAPICRTT